METLGREVGHHSVVYCKRGASRTACGTSAPVRARYVVFELHLPGAPG